MSTKISMVDVKRLLKTQLERLGYDVRVSKFTEFTFDLRTPGGTIHSRIHVGSANAKRFEIKVESDNAGGFRIAPRCTGEGRKQKWAVYKRFTKREDVIPSCLRWVAESTEEFGHLRQLLGLEPPPSPHAFAEGEFVERGIFTYCGHVESAVARSLAALNGRDIVEAVYTPGTRPYVLVGAKVRPTVEETTSFSTELVILTDGELWYPTWKSNSIHKILEVPGMMARLRQMNQADRRLIHMACQSFVSKNYGEEAHEE